MILKRNRRFGDFFRSISSCQKSALLLKPLPQSEVQAGPMAQYSYPLLQSDEILTVLRELTIDATSDDLINPTPQKVHVVFSQLVELLLNQKQEDTAQPQLSGIDMLEYPELHEESVPAMAFITAWCASNLHLARPGAAVLGVGRWGRRAARARGGDRGRRVCAGPSHCRTASFATPPLPCASPAAVKS